ncbi:DUF3592 domain-containing protein [Amycolatopsis sp. NPDC051372]|uniref:DUF3592 domain-containing protein n=1 Tax=Amycolatopsis sp. NPDC051372 TaxID=3155669 RepID=UPI00343EAB56
MALAAGLVAVLGVLHSADTLLTTGTRVPGTVVSVATPPKGTRWIDVSFRADGRLVTERVDRSSTDAYTPGERVTVVFDPADPGRARTTTEEGLSENGVDFAWIGVGLVLAATGAVGWSRRSRAVRRTGWHEGTATVVLAPRTGRGVNPPYLHVRLLSGGAVRLRAVPSTHGARFLRTYTDRPAWLGGPASQAGNPSPPSFSTPRAATSSCASTFPMAGGSPPAPWRRYAGATPSSAMGRSKRGSPAKAAVSSSHCRTT